MEGAYKRAQNVWQEQGPHKGALLRLDFLAWYRYYNFINLQWQLQDMQMQLQGLYRCLVRYKWSALNIFLGIHILETEAEKANFFFCLRSHLQLHENVQKCHEDLATVAVLVGQLFKVNSVTQAFLVESDFTWSEIT